MKRILLILTVVLIFVGLLYIWWTGIAMDAGTATKPQGDIVAVRIDGKDLTRGDILRNGKVILQLNMNKARRKNIRKREVRALEKYCRSAVGREISKVAVSRYVKDRNIQVSTSVIARVEKRFESQYGVMSKKLRRRHKIDDLKFMLGKNAFRLDEMIMETALFDAMTNDVIRRVSITVTDDDIAQRLKAIKEGNEKARIVTYGVYEKATNVWEKIVAKEMTFESAALKYSEDEYIKDGCEWGCFTSEQLEGEDALLAVLPNLKTGDITPPLQSDSGVAIIRKDEDDNDKTFSFSRIFFRLPYFYEEENPEQARKVLEKRKSIELVQKTMDEYIAKLKIEYPNGTNAIWKITQKDFK